MSENTTKETKSGCCCNPCNCTSKDLAEFLRHLASYFEKKNKE